MLIQKQASEIVILNSEKVINHLNELVLRIQYWQSEFEEWDQFEKKKFSNVANAFLRLTPSAQAINYINEDYIISEVYPIQTNKKALGKTLSDHPDPEIRKIFREGLSKEKITFTPPVELLQGGTAIVFYAPINFKKGSTAWLGIVVRIDQLLSDFIGSSTSGSAYVSIKDKSSNRYLHRGSGVEEIEYSASKEVLFMGRLISFEKDTGLLMHDLKEKYSSLSILLSLILILLCTLLFFYFNNIEETRINLIDTLSEKNLLRMLFHDLTNPLAIVQLYAIELKEKYPNETFLPKVLTRIDDMSEVISSIRHLDLLNRNIDTLQENRIDLNEIFSKLLISSQDAIQKKSLVISIESGANIVKEMKIPPELFKNEIINNLLSNSIKFAFDHSEIRIQISEDFIKFTNKSLPISEAVMKDLNEVRPTSSRAVSIQRAGHGLGFFIAKILSRKFYMDLSVKQDIAKEEVYTTLDFRHIKNV